MSGNHSRYSHQRDKLYSEVSLLQGAMVTDADQREAQAVAERGGRIQSDMAMASGVPKTGGVLEYDTQANTPPDIVSAKRLVPGQVVADGAWGVVRLRDGESLSSGDALELVGKQADYLAGAEPADNQHYLVFADIWDRHVGPAEDARLLDSAFLGAETSTRKERMAQLKLVKADAFSADDREIIQEGLPRFGAFRLTKAELKALVLPQDDCDPCATTDAGEIEAANGLFRFEVHDSDFAEPGINAGTIVVNESGSKIKVKFSMDNGSIEVEGEHADQLKNDGALDNKVFEIADLTSEQQYGLVSQPVVARQAEIVGKQGLLAKTDQELEGKIIRVWDGAVELDLSKSNLDPVSVGPGQFTGSITSSGGKTVVTFATSEIELTFGADLLAGKIPFILPGDAWAIDIREFADANGDHLRFDPEPVEAEHRYTYLGAVQNKNFVAEKKMSDMRSRAFPALTDLTAQQVEWSNHHHKTVKTNTVQGALDILFGREDGDCACTFCINSSKKLHEQLEEIRDKLIDMDKQKPDLRQNAALICFPRGVFELEQSVDLSRLGHVTLRGVGREATEIRITDGETLMVTACEALTIEDLSLLSEGKSGSALLAVMVVDTIDISRAMFSASPGPDEKDNAFPLVQIEQDKAESESAIWVRDCIFNILENRIGLVISSEGMQTIQECQFIGVPPYYSKRIIGLVPKVFKGIKYRRKPQGVTPGKDSGIYMLTGGGQNVLDLTAYPVAERDRIFEFVEGYQDVFAENDLGSKSKWNAFMDKATGGAMAAIDDSSTPAAAAPVPAGAGAGGAAIAAGTGRPSGRRGNIGFSMRGAGAAPTRAGLAAAAAAPAGAGAVFNFMAGRRMVRHNAFMALLNAGAGTPSAAVTNAVNALAPNDLIKIREVLDAFTTRTSLATYQRNFGLVIDGGEMSGNFVSGNYFEWVHSSIIVKGENGVSNDAHIPLTANTTIKDNRILRAAIRGLSVASFSKDIFPAAITCDDVGYVKLENNLIQQSFGDSSSIGDYLKYLSDLKAKSEGFFAIELRGAVGPVVHATGNDAVYFSHTIGVTGGVAYQAKPSDNALMRQNVWMFRENTVLPCPNDSFTALFFAKGLGRLTSNNFLRDAWQRDDFNHPPMK